QEDKHAIYMKINLGVAVCGSIFLMLFAPLIIDLFFTPEFAEATGALQIMAASLIFMSLSNIYGVNFLIIRGYEKKLRNITLICSAIGFITAFPLVYFYSYIGAALNILMARILLGVSIM